VDRSTSSDLECVVKSSHSNVPDCGENVASEIGWRSCWHTQQTQNLSPAVSVLFETLLSCLNPNKKTSMTRSRRLQAFLSISRVFEGVFTQFFTQWDAD
jgi:hypothetical protein